MGYIKTLEEAKELLQLAVDFNAGSLTATTEDGFYVVRSYGVPIAYSGAYHLEIYPTAYSHSKTTSKHANIVAKAWGLN